MTQWKKNIAHDRRQITLRADKAMLSGVQVRSEMLILTLIEVLAITQLFFE